MKFFMDFDGVLCDSALECYASSLMAIKSEALPPSATIEPDRYRAFMKLRPFIRNPEDYLIIQEALDRGISISEQGEFDALREAKGEEGLALFASRFISARSRFLASDPELWYRMNPPFEGIAELLCGVSSNDGFFILSTKRADFINALLSRWGVPWPAKRVISSRTELKRDLILGMASPREAGGLHFVDDQEEHLKACQGSGIELYAAAWGYRIDGAPSVGRVISLEEFKALVSGLA